MNKFLGICALLMVYHNFALATFVEPVKIPVYRYSNGYDHLYTTDCNEIGTTKFGQVGKFGYQSEGIGFYVYNNPCFDYVPLYRFWKPSYSLHFYATDTSEYLHDRSYEFQGIVGYLPRRPTAGAKKLHRWRNSRESNMHIYTIDEYEQPSGWYKIDFIIPVYGFVLPSPVPPQTAPTKIPCYRFFNGRNYFYTTNWNEIGTRVIGQAGNFGYKYEGIGFNVYDKPYLDYAPLHRFFLNGFHIYTHNRNEYNNGYEGIVGYLPIKQCTGSRRLYRFRNTANPYMHYYTVNRNEIKSGFRFFDFSVPIHCF